MDQRNLLRGIIQRLLYSEVFQHPLKLEELTGLIAADEKTIQENLELLCSTQLVQQEDGYYYVFDSGTKINRRKSGNDKAQLMMPKAHRIGRKIYRFPYVKGVGISGSLSKGVLHADGDFDYFIITQPNRLWVARTLLILYKKVFLLNSRKHFCVNYFIDTENLEIEEKNPFTATEITTLIPVAGEVMGDFFNANAWTRDYLRKNDKITAFDTVNKPLLSKTITYTLNGKLGEWADQKFMRMTLKRWERKFGSLESDTFDLTMKSRKYISKHHPNNFQRRVLDSLNELKQKYAQLHQEELANLGIEL